MSTLRVSAEQLTIEPHPNADALELAVVGAFRAVVGKGTYRTGDWATYIPEQAILPDALIAELGLTGKLAGKAANRVKAIRLRGELSQGIVARPQALAGVDLARAAAEGIDFAERLDITKWMPEVPANMAGEMESAPELIPWIEIENIKRYPEIFQAGEQISASEKAHGTATLVSLDLLADRLFVSSKGFGAKRLAIKESPSNLYWRAVRVHDVEDKMRRLAELLEARRLGLFGETYGAGVQDLHYGVSGRNEPGFVVFDLYVEGPAYSGWLDQGKLRRFCALVSLPVAPELYHGSYDYNKLAALAEGPTVLGGGVHLREGLVVRPLSERRSEVLGGRAIAKFVSEAYLTRKGGTEYE